MNGVSIAVFGPSDGAIAFSLSTGKVLSDDTLFLATSDFQLNENETTIVFSRINSSKNNHIRVSIYRQINEPNLRRLGHSFGASIDFYERLPEPELILKTLRELTVVLEEGCCKTGSFCNTTIFNKFVDEYLLPNYVGITESLWGKRSEKNSTFYQRINDKKFFYLSTEENLQSDTNNLLSWFAFKPGGMFCRSLVVALKHSGIPGPSYNLLENTTEIDEEATNWLIADNIQIRLQLERISRDLTLRTSLLNKRNNDIIKIENELVTANNKINNLLKNYKNVSINNSLSGQSDRSRRTLSLESGNYKYPPSSQRPQEKQRYDRVKEEEIKPAFEYWFEIQVICVVLIAIIVGIAVLVISDRTRFHW